MTVRELIERLKEYDQDKVVHTIHGDWGVWVEIEDIMSDVAGIALD